MIDVATRDPRAPTSTTPTTTMRTRRMAWRKAPRLPKAEEKAELERIDESFGKGFAKGARVVPVRYTDERDQHEKE